jgi:phenylpropionate dioxygenase-like ring-hydroxylating dioxygenase large terminal subunit
MDTVVSPEANFQKGFGTTTSPNFRDVAAADARPVPQLLTAESAPDLGSARIPVKHYISPEIHRREVEEIWKKTWQVTCREEEIPEIGDHFVYNVSGLSFLIVRTDVQSFKAYWNVCMHRGRKLVDHGGEGACQFKCAYHGWAWSIDGGLKYFPGKWDFPDVSGSSHNLQEVQIDRWGGFLFINPDLTAGPLADHLGKLPEHFAFWPLEDRFTTWHLRKRIRANWKVGIEAFLESYHVVQTHPQALPSVAEHGTQYDVYDEDTAFYSRLITPVAVPSHHAKDGSREGALIEMWALLNALRRDEVAELPEGVNDRASLADWRRRTLGELTGADYSKLPDTMMLDSIQYWLWPNFCPWMGEGLPLAYIFRPDTDSPDTCYMDVWMLIRRPDNGDPRPAAELVDLGPDDHFEPYIGAIGTIFDQDDQNMPQVHDGMKTWPDQVDGCTLGRYQESRIRFLHQILQRKLAL